MAPDTAHIDIAQWIRKVFQSGFHLNRERLDEMEASFGISEPAELLADDSTGEAASFLDLLFFPDLAIRETFETQWGNRTFTRDTVHAVLEALRQPPVTATLHIDGQNKPFELNVSDDVSAAFVQRLRIAWQSPEALRLTLQSRLEPPQRAMVGSYLRHARLPWHGNQVAMMDLFIAKFEVARDNFQSCLTFLLSIIETLEPEQDLFEFLIAKKFFFFQSLCKAEAFENRRQTTNMEILILQGERAAHGNIDEWRSHMRQMDHICQTLFGQTRFFQQPMVQQTNLAGGPMDCIVDFFR